MATAILPDRKAKISKRSVNSYGAEDWTQHRPLITRLYFEEGRTLKDVREHLEREFGFSPTERMYKSRLHAWGLDKKKKEHEMLDVVRQGLQQSGDDKEKVFNVRGRQVTLADALHYFNRKGIKDPASLLEAQPELNINNLSSPEDADVKTPTSSHLDHDLITPTTTEMSDYEHGHISIRPGPIRKDPSLHGRRGDFVDRMVAILRDILESVEGQQPSFRRDSPVEATVSPTNFSPSDQALLEAIYQQTQNHYRGLFTSRNFTINNVQRTWTATSDDSPSDKFYIMMYHGYAFLWNKQREPAFQEFYKAFALVESLLRDEDASFLVYLYDLTIRYDGTGLEEPLLMLWKHVADMAITVFGTPNNPVSMIAGWIMNATCSRSAMIEVILRRLVDFFQDSLGYFHPETIAVLQTFSTALLMRKHYGEAIKRYQQLADAFETTQSPHCVEVCYATRMLGDAYFHMGRYAQSLQALNKALDLCKTLPRSEEREIHVRCIRGVAEIFAKVGRRQEALDCMQYVVDTCRNDFGPEHQFTLRARMHLKSMAKGEIKGESTIPFSVHHLGRAGRASKYIWVSRNSPTRLEA